MSDEAHMEAAFRRSDPTRRSQWHEIPPDEALIALEEGPVVAVRRAEILEGLMAFLFADGCEDWRRVAVRGMAALCKFAPAVAVGMETAVERFHGYGLEEMGRMIGEDVEEARKVMGWLFQERGPRGLVDGCQRCYLVAKAYQPYLLQARVAEKLGAGVEWQEMGFEDMARAFGELDGLSGKEQGARARSRWSARAVKMVRSVLEQADARGGKADLFGKMSATREKYAAAAIGNKNRQKTLRQKTED